MAGRTALGAEPGRQDPVPSQLQCLGVARVRQLALVKVTGPLHFSVKPLQNCRQPLEVLPIRRRDYVHVLGGADIAVVTDSDPTDQQELDPTLHQFPEDCLNIELSQGAGAVQPLQPGT